MAEQERGSSHQGTAQRTAPSGPDSPTQDTKLSRSTGYSEPIVIQGPLYHDEDDTFSAMSFAGSRAEIFKHHTLHGRCYQGDANDRRYWLPFDGRHQDFMDHNHHYLTMCLDDKLYLAPLDKSKVKKVLDIGTGTGIWAIDFADTHQDTEVIGTDISPIQPHWIPPNVVFEIDDAEEPWVFGPEVFDYVHLRYLFGSIRDWHRLMRQAYDAMTPGAWIESMEVDPVWKSDDNTVEPDSAMQMWCDLFLEASARDSERPLSVVTENLQARSMKAAGFVDVTIKDIPVPIGGWHSDPKLKQIGQFCVHVIERDLEGSVAYLWTDVLNRPVSEMHIFLMMFRQELHDKSIHAYATQRVVYGRKPEQPPVEKDDSPFTHDNLAIRSVTKEEEEEEVVVET